MQYESYYDMFYCLRKQMLSAYTLAKRYDDDFLFDGKTVGRGTAGPAWWTAFGNACTINCRD
jgi:hypothetical protein